MQKVSLQSQIAAVEAITSGRFSVIASGPSARNLLVEQLKAVSATLRLVQRHEAEIRALIERRREGRA